MATAVIKSGGKQYRVSEGDLIRIEKLQGESGETVSFSEVLLVSNEGTEPQVGKPFLDGASVKGEIVKHGRGPKLVVFKFRRRKRSKVKKGHRQDYTAVRITAISA